MAADTAKSRRALASSEATLRTVVARLETVRKRTLAGMGHPTDASTTADDHLVLKPLLNALATMSATAKQLKAVELILLGGFEGRGDGKKKLMDYVIASLHEAGLNSGDATGVLWPEPDDDQQGWYENALKRAKKRF
jgi:hypothetical protein